MFFLAKGIWTFKLLRSKYGDKSLYIFGMRECRVGEVFKEVFSGNKINRSIQKGSAALYRKQHDGNRVIKAEN